jgi:uncharacterized BrkB/YihY/UPF0761 family membrane protein
MSSEPTQESEDLPNSYWRRWYVYAYWSLPLFGFIVVMILSTVAGAAGLPGLPGAPELVVILATILGLLAIPMGFWALFGYYWDAKVLKERGSWGVWWPPWVLGHLLFSPLIVAPFYLALRTRNTGYPWNNGYTIR